MKLQVIVYLGQYHMWWAFYKMTPTLPVVSREYITLSRTSITLWGKPGLEGNLH